MHLSLKFGVVTRIAPVFCRALSGQNQGPNHSARSEHPSIISRFGASHGSQVLLETYAWVLIFFFTLLDSEKFGGLGGRFDGKDGFADAFGLPEHQVFGEVGFVLLKVVRDLLKVR